MLRIRTFKIDGSPRQAIVTYKDLISNIDGLKKQKEIEFSVPSITNFLEFIGCLGFTRTLIYEKKREDWHYNNSAMISIDRLPFGTFIEIEGEEKIVNSFEFVLGLTKNVEEKSYPVLTIENGITEGNIYVARF